MSNGWIKLHRELLEKPIWESSTPEQKTILITLMAMANHQEKEWEWKGEKYKAEPGQFVTSLPSIVQKSGKGISTQNVRTALKRFEKLEFLTDESTKQNRLITLLNWGLYQHVGGSLTDDLTVNQQTTNSQLTANKKVIKKEGKKEHIPYEEIISYLNEKAGKNFSHTSQGNQKVITARWNEGNRLEEFVQVIDVCCNKWKGVKFSDGKMGDNYLQPSTLFNGKFDERLNWSIGISQVGSSTKTSNSVDMGNMIEAMGGY